MIRPYAVPNGVRYARYLALDAAERAYWAGRGAEQLGLIGHVEPKQFYLLEDGKHPETKERLRQRITPGQTHNGKNYSRGRTVYDVVVMAPKSAGILSLFDDRIVEAHKETVKEIQSRIEDHACVRVRKGELHETDAVRPTKNIVAGVWQHEKSRELDPLLHSHIALLNMSFDQEEGRWKALQPVGIYRHRWDLSEAYRRSLANRIEDCGYELVPRKLNDIRYPKDFIENRECGFEINGVSTEIVGRFSTRTKQRDEAIKNYPGEELNERIIDKLVREHRREKQPYGEAERIETRQKQMERLTPYERATLRDTVERSYEETSPKLRLRMDVAEGEDRNETHRLTYGQRISL
jgi:conjugative relaxase-like TrwC/TraI family protein